MSEFQEIGVDEVPIISYPIIKDADPSTVVIYCSDPRFNYACEMFIQKTLNLPPGKYLPLIFGGGAGVLAHPCELPKESKFVMDRLEYWRHRFPNIKRIVLINHEDCRYYQQIKDKIMGFLPKNTLMDKIAKADLLTVARLLKSTKFMTGFDFDIYYVKFKDETKTSAIFERVI